MPDGDANVIDWWTALMGITESALRRLRHSLLGCPTIGLPIMLLMVLSSGVSTSCLLTGDWSVDLNLEGSYSQAEMLRYLLRSSDKPSWSRDGSQIAFLDMTYTYIAPSDGTGIQLIRLQTAGAAISPTDDLVLYPTNLTLDAFGKEIEKMDYGINDYDIEVADLDGSNRRRLTVDIAQDFNAV